MAGPMARSAANGEAMDDEKLQQALEHAEKSRNMAEAARDTALKVGVFCKMSLCTRTHRY